jgi:His-Xaa-Ser system protein HxsD
MQNLCRTPDGSLVVQFDRKVYKLNAVKKAAYKYGGLFYVLLDETDEFITATLKSKADCQAPNLAAEEFCNEVLDQELREEIAAETSGIRDLLLAHAFSKTSLIDLELETDDYAANMRDTAKPSKAAERTVVDVDGPPA